MGIVLELSVLLAPLAVIIILNLGSWRDTRHLTRISLKSFKKIYAINPDSWKLYSASVYRKIRERYEVIPIISNSGDWNATATSDQTVDEYDPVTDKYYKYTNKEIELAFGCWDYIKYQFWKFKVNREKAKREKLNKDTETLQFLRTLTEEDIKIYTDRIKREGQEQLDKLLREAEERERKFNKGVRNHEPGIDEGVSSIIT